MKRRATPVHHHLAVATGTFMKRDMAVVVRRPGLRHLTPFKAHLSSSYPAYLSYIHAHSPPQCSTTFTAGDDLLVSRCHMYVASLVAVTDSANLIKLCRGCLFARFSVAAWTTQLIVVVVLMPELLSQHRFCGGGAPLRNACVQLT